MTKTQSVIDTINRAGQIVQLNTPQPDVIRVRYNGKYDIDLIAGPDIFDAVPAEILDPEDGTPDVIVFVEKDT